MNNLNKHPLNRLGYGFIPPEFLPDGKDEYYIRNTQQPVERRYRSLKANEIETLIKNANTADDWGRIHVTDRFDPELVKNCQFFGMVRIGDLEPVYLEYHDLRLPVGLYDSIIVSCDIGCNVAIKNVHYMAHYIIGDEVMLLTIDEMHASNHAKFGNGILKDGEDESVRIWLELWNEMEGRAVVPFDGMLPADAWLWAKHRDNLPLMRRLMEITDARFDKKRGYYGTIGNRCVIKHCNVIKDVKIGSHAYIKGANKLKNLTINSDEHEATQIGEGVELVNGIIGHGCHVFYGVKAVRFIMGTRTNLKYGARLINSYLGDNSTVSCCEMLHNLIFPSHEQHHNNSFLIAACLKGQSNIAAGATIGSNHNSRANDGEILAGRGFWPGLCSSLKHNCRFSSFTLLAKGAYPAELDVPIPFSLVSNNESKDCLQVMPAYWFLYNMYALVRNAWKFGARDKRVHADQKMEFDYLAPDSVEEIISGLELLEEWVGRAWLSARGNNAKATRQDLVTKGRDLLIREPQEVSRLEVLGERMENSRRKVQILRPERAWPIYREMVHYYAVKNLVRAILENDLNGIPDIKAMFPVERVTRWSNVGGQLMKSDDEDALKAKIVNGELDSWDKIHDEYARLWARYPRDKAEHAYGVLLAINGITPDTLTSERWLDYLERAHATQKKILDLTADSRRKDYENPFKRMSFDSQEEMDAVMGRFDDNSFIKQITAETQAFSDLIDRVKALEAKQTTST